MIGNTNGIYIPQGGNKTYIDLVPLIDITALGTIDSSGVSSATYIKREQHFWYSGNCNLEDYMEIQLSVPNNSSIKETLKFKYRYLIPNTPTINNYSTNSRLCYLYNSNDVSNIIRTVQFKDNLGWSSFNMVLTEPSLISGILILRTNKNSTNVAAGNGSEMLIKVTKGSTEIIPIYADYSSLLSTSSIFYMTVLVQNVYD